MGIYQSDISGNALQSFIVSMTLISLISKQEELTEKLNTNNYIKTTVNRETTDTYSKMLPL